MTRPTSVLAGSSSRASLTYKIKSFTILGMKKKLGGVEIVKKNRGGGSNGNILIFFFGLTCFFFFPDFFLSLSMYCHPPVRIVAIFLILGLRPGGPLSPGGPGGQIQNPGGFPEKHNHIVT